MTNDDNNRLYRVLGNRICERIFRGDYKDGENLPPERILAESLGISRVTVRKALALLEERGIIQRLQGSGNRVSLSLAGYPGTMDLIAVVAPAQNAFFSAFIDCFQRIAENGDSLVLFRQIQSGEGLEDGLFKLFQKNIRNAVIWLEDQAVDMEAIRRLRGLGMNMVFFDVVTPSPYADGVLLDNVDAIRSLRDALMQRGKTAIAYVGWDKDSLLSAKEREAAFCKQHPAPVFVRRIPWAERKNLCAEARQIAQVVAGADPKPLGIVCGDGEIGLAIRKALNAEGLSAIAVASPDEYPDSLALSISIYRQDFERMADETYQCLSRQNQPDWRASTYRIKGSLIGESVSAGRTTVAGPFLETQ